MRDKRVKIAVILLLCIFVITISVTVAFFNYMKKGTTENVLRTSTIMLHYDETNKMGQGISIEDALPADSNESEKTNNHYFEFNISGVSNKEDISYLVTARKAKTSSDIDSDIDIYLTDEYDNPLFEGIHKYSELVQYRENTNYTEKVIYTDTMEGNGVELNKNFRLRMWIDEKTNFSDGSYNDKTFKITVNVYTADISDYTPIPVSGFYDLNGTQIYTWQQLLDNNYLKVENGVLSSGTEFATFRELDGSLVIDNTVTEIGTGSLSSTPKLTSVYIPNTITKFNQGAFASSGISSIIFEKNSSLQLIDEYAFQGTNNLKTITIPNSVTTLGVAAFNSANLENIYFEKNSKLETISTASFGNIAPLKGIEIPASVKTIGPHAFTYSSSTPLVDNFTVTFEEGSKLETFDNCAFCNRKNMKSIEIPANVTLIKASAFANTGLETITFASNSKLESVTDSAFYVGPALKNVVLPASLKSIGSNSFRDNTELSSVTFTNPNGWSIGGIPIDSSDLSNPTTAATYVKSTYLNSTWTRTN